MAMTNRVQRRRTSIVGAAHGPGDAGLRAVWIGMGAAALALGLAITPASAQVANPIEPGYDPIDRPAEGLGANRIEPGYDPIDQPAEGGAAVPQTVVQWVPSSRIDETNVDNLRGETVGEVESLYQDFNGRYWAVVAFGETLGLGGQLRSVPLGDMYYNGTAMVLPGATEAWVEALPELEYATQQYSELDRDFLVPIRFLWSAIDAGQDPIYY